MPYVGARIKRIEDPKFITGSARYVDDISLPGTLYMAILRSTVPHARLLRVDYSDALKIPGVVGVITGLNISVENRPRNFPMARDEILYVGQPIAAVVAEDRYKAFDALDLIQVDYEPLPAVVDPEDALNDNVKAVEGRSNIGYKTTYRSGNPEDALKRSDVVIETKLEIGRVYPAPMEPRGLLAVFQEGRLTVYASTQSPHYMRKFLLDAFRSHVSDVRVIQADVGGAFGSKLFPYPEDYIVTYASILYRRPVKWVATRREDLMSTYHSRAQIHKLKAGFSKSGEWLALIDDLIIDLGAATHGYYLADTTATLITGPYRVRDVLVNVYGVMTNKTPLDQYRGAGRPEAAFVYERIMDMAADELKMDPVEIRRRNLITSLPYENPFGHKYDSGNYLHLLSIAEEYYRESRRRAEEFRRQGRRVGVGLSIYVEQNNFGPWESASVRVKSNGKVLVIIGAAPHGQGDATAIAQIVADELGIDINQVEVSWGDTELIGEGFGTYGSRTLTLAGSASLIAARKLKEKLKRLGATLMGVNYEEVIYEGGQVVHTKTRKSMSIGEITSRVTSVIGGTWAFDVEPSLEETAYFGLPGYTYPYGSHVALAEVTEEGLVRVLDYVAIDDVGLVVNPMLAEGQVIGGVIQGFGEVALEEVKYDRDGNLLTQTFGEYWIPTIEEFFRVKWIYVEEGKSNAPLPSKGIAESSMIGVLPAITRAIEDAVGRRITKIPVDPESLIITKTTANNLNRNVPG
ncbi:glyceraldehyde dehydrogenase subunit alpha [Vulcanisaeta thermophila]|uniref:glyceraldehyde dehydrogenase subunit alpha n=1 Tax=Vulcanisaeta thermophila TaxID=867917 RepID=UPI000852D451|nr:glyceraldehyde dehydrogenase subunit alpha [Vulcanisaeta thermophila]